MFGSLIKNASFLPECLVTEKLLWCPHFYPYSKANSELALETASGHWIRRQSNLSTTAILGTEESGRCRVRVEQESIGSLSSDVFEWRTSTGSEAFSLLVSLYATIFVLPSVFTLKETICPKICSKSRLKCAKKSISGWRASLKNVAA